MKKRSNQNSNSSYHRPSWHNHRNNPKRGPPGILIFCEVGRERKCIAEGMDILNHYYNQNNNGPTTATTNNNNNSENNNDDHDNLDSENEKTMTLEEELKLMKQAKKNAPFKVYDTGCKGSVFFMCTTSNCHQIIIPSVAVVDSSSNDDAGNDTNQLEGEQNDDDGVHKKEIENKKRKSDHNEQQEIPSSIASDTKRTKIESTDIANATTAATTTATTTSTANKWDPIQMIQSMVQDLCTTTTTNNPSYAPRSRFITKMIPIQATCFANVEEITPVMTLLLARHLLPFGIQYYHDNSSDGDGDCDGDCDGDDKRKKGLPTFKIEFRKRFCTHLKRDSVINIVANAVDTLTQEYWENSSAMHSSNATTSATTDNDNVVDDVVDDDDGDDKQDTGSEMKDDTEEGKEKKEKKKCPPLFGVDLSNPDYTIIIEICRTLCTMSVVKDAQSFHLFNLAKIQEEVKKES
jgi:hypothetical protein